MKANLHYDVPIYVAPFGGEPLEPYDPAKTLTKALFQSLKPISLGVGLLNFVLALGHFVVLTDMTRTIMVSLATGSAISLLVLHILCTSKSTVIQNYAHLIGFAIVFILGVNCLVHIGLTGEEKHSTNVALLIVSAGCFFMSTKWLLSTLALLSIGWVYAISATTVNPDWIHFGFMIFVAFVLGTLVHQVRKSLVLDKEKLVHDQAEMAQEYKEESLRDELTEIGNRRSFDRTLELEWRRSARSTAPLSLLLIDIDYFKQYNDTYGHQEGDACLQSVAKIIVQTLNRPGDSVSRYGGEEFAVLLPETSIDGAIVVANRIRRYVEDRGIKHETSKFNNVTLSVGVATTIPKRSLSMIPFIETSDKALYRAKKKGRNCVEGEEVQAMIVCSAPHFS